MDKICFFVFSFVTGVMVADDCEVLGFVEPGADGGLRRLRGSST